MKLFVSGGAGFIGSHYVRTMLAGGYPGHESTSVTVLDKLTYAGNLANLPMGHERLSFHRGDVCDHDLLATLLPGHDMVVHFAAESHVDRSLVHPGEFVRTNALGTQAILGASLRAAIKRVVYVSTDEVYGSIAEGAWTEEARPRPNSLYAASKAAGDLLAHAYWRTHGLPVCVTRSSNNYGPYQFPEKLIPLFITNLLEGEQVPLYGDGGNVREWLHVDDHCRAIQLVLERGRPGDIYNIGGGQAATNAEVAIRLLDLCGAERSKLRYVADRKGHDRRYALEYTKIGSQFGYRPRISFDEGLAEVVDWYRDNPGWWKPLKKARSGIRFDESNPPVRVGRP